MILGARGTRGILVIVLGLWALVVTARGQQSLPEDPEDDKRFGLWLDQEVSARLWTNKSLELEFHQRFDEGASNFYEYSFQGGVAFRIRRWFTVLPIYRYRQSPKSYENRILLNLSLSRSRGAWRPTLRTRIEGRFPSNRPPFARFRFRPGIDYVLPLPKVWRPALTVNNEFLLVPWYDPYASGGTYTQNRLQFGVKLPATKSLTVQPFYMLQSENEPEGWSNNEILGISTSYRISRKNR